MKSSTKKAKKEPNYNCRVGDTVRDSAHLEETWKIVEVDIPNEHGCPLNFKAERFGFIKTFSPFEPNILVFPPASELQGVVAPTGFLIAREPGLSWLGYRLVHAKTLDVVYLRQSTVETMDLRLQIKEGELYWSTGKPGINECYDEVIGPRGKVLSRKLSWVDDIVEKVEHYY
jgi:hypothetical protein